MSQSIENKGQTQFLLGTNEHPGIRAASHRRPKNRRRDRKGGGAAVLRIVFSRICTTGSPIQSLSVRCYIQTLQVRSHD